MTFVIEIRDAGRVRYAQAGNAGHVGFADRYRDAARFDEDEVEDQARFYREMLDDPQVDVAVVE